MIFIQTLVPELNSVSDESKIFANKTETNLTSVFSISSGSVLEIQKSTNITDDATADQVSII